MTYLRAACCRALDRAFVAYVLDNVLLLERVAALLVAVWFLDDLIRQRTPVVAIGRSDLQFVVLVFLARCSHFPNLRKDRLAVPSEPSRSVWQGNFLVGVLGIVQGSFEEDVVVMCGVPLAFVHPGPIFGFGLADLLHHLVYTGDWRSILCVLLGVVLLGIILIIHCFVVTAIGRPARRLLLDLGLSWSPGLRL